MSDLSGQMCDPASTGHFNVNPTTLDLGNVLPYNFPGTRWDASCPCAMAWYKAAWDTINGFTWVIPAVQNPGTDLVPVPNAPARAFYMPHSNTKTTLTPETPATIRIRAPLGSALYCPTEVPACVVPRVIVNPVADGKLGDADFCDSGNFIYVGTRGGPLGPVSYGICGSQAINKLVLDAQEAMRRGEQAGKEALAKAQKMVTTTVDTWKAKTEALIREGITKLQNGIKHYFPISQTALKPVHDSYGLGQPGAPAALV